MRPTGAPSTATFTPKTRIEVLVDDAAADGAVEAIVNSARTDKIGDGKVWVSDVSGAVRIALVSATTLSDPSKPCSIGCGGSMFFRASDRR